MKVNGIDNPILVQSSNVDLGDALPTHCREKIEGVVGKYFNRLTEAVVHFKREGSMVECTVRLKMGALRPWAAGNIHHNPYRAFNNALASAATQMRRAKRELHEDKPVRLDKDVFLTGTQSSATKRKVLVPNPTDIADEKPNLTTMQGADDYAKAMLQKAKQDQSLRADPGDIDEWRGKLAAE